MRGPCRLSFTALSLAVGRLAKGWRFGFKTLPPLAKAVVGPDRIRYPVR